jgi:hypothetical protein
LIARDIAVHGVDPTSDKDGLLARERHLKVIVAELRDVIPQVDTSQVEAELDQVVETAQGILREYAALAEDEGALVPGSISLRMARSARKATMAAARLDGQVVATSAHVACAGRMLAMKLEVIKWLCSQEGQVMVLGGLEAQEQAVLLVRTGRREKMMDLYGGMELSAAQILAGLRAEGFKAGERTIMWDLRQRGVEIQGGKYKVPTQQEWEKKLREAERQGKEKVEPARAPQPEDLLPKVQQGFQPKDTLGRMPVLLRPMARALAGWDFDRQDEQAKKLLRYVTDAELRPLEGPLGVAWFRCNLNPNVQVTVESVREMERVLTQEPWEVRGKLALQLYTQIADMPTIPYLLEDTLLRNDLPEALRRDIESAIRRRAYLDQCYYKGVPANIIL